MGMKEILFQNSDIEFYKEQINVVMKEECPEIFREKHEDFILWHEKHDIRLETLIFRLEMAQFKRTIMRVSILLSFISTLSIFAPDMLSILVGLLT